MVGCVLIGTYMRLTVQMILAFWLVLLATLTAMPREEAEFEREQAAAHLQIGRELAEQQARIAVTEREVEILRMEKVPQRLAIIESNQQDQKYMLISLLLGVAMLLLKDLKTYLKAVKERRM